jgi:hypothetical protein
MDILLISKWVGSSSIIGGVTWAARHMSKRLNEHRERLILDALETTSGSLSVSSIENHFRGYTLRGMHHLRYLPALRPGGDPFNEADRIPTPVPLRVRLRYGWRIKVKREIPTEQKVRDILRSLKARGYLEFTGEDSWRLQPK